MKEKAYSHGTISSIDEQSTAAIDDRIVVMKKNDYDLLKWRIESLERDMKIYRKLVFSHLKLVFSHISNMNAHKEGFRR